MALVRSADKFEIIIDKLDKSVRIALDKLIKKLALNPEIGKPMRHNRKGTREVYLSPFRLSYIYEPDTDTIILLDLYHKDQQ